MVWVIFLFVVIVICGASTDNGGNGVDLSYSCVRLETTRDDLSPILLMHGLSGYRGNWKGIDEALAEQTNRLVCVSDARNHGLSPKTEEFSIDLMAEDTIRLLDKLEISKAILLGQSMGGKVAAVTALRYPDRVDKLLVEDMRPVTFTPEALAWVKGMMQMMRKSEEVIPEGATEEEAVEAVVNFFQHAFKAANMEMGDDMKEKIKSRLVCDEGRCHFIFDFDFVAKVLDEPYWNMAPDGLFKGNALFIYGKISPFKVNEAEDEIRQRFSNAQLFGIDGASHDVHGEKPKEFLSAVIKFINGNIIKNEL